MKSSFEPSTKAPAATTVASYLSLESRRAGFLLAALVLLSCRADPESPLSPATRLAPIGPPMRAIDVVMHPEWTGRLLAVDLYENLLDAEHSSYPRSGEYDIGDWRLVLAAGTLRPLPKGLRPPLRVVATYMLDARGMRLEVSSLTPLSWPTPERVAPENLVGRVGPYGRYVQIVGTWQQGFEFSQIGPLWVQELFDVVLRCEPAAQAPDAEVHADRVRITGMAYGEEGEQYGHLDGWKALLVATEVVYLDANDNDCARGLRSR